MKRIILASQSPRRKQLLDSVGIACDVIASGVDETLDTSIPIGEACEKIALAKAKQVHDLHPDCIVIAADTLVVLDEEVLGKPENAEVAKAMLCRLNGRSHEVISAVAICHGSTYHVFHETTCVHFRQNDEALFDAYSQNESLDKAGGYGIQDFGKVFVASIQGDYYSVVGLPIAKVFNYIMAINET